MDKGWIKINRSFFDHFLWNEDRPKTKAEAWLDLIQLARHEVSPTMINGVKYVANRGQVIGGKRYYAARWKWSNGKVKRFLKLLKDEHQIIFDSKENISVVNLCNYDKYQGVEDHQTDHQTAPPIKSANAYQASNYRQHVKYNEPPNGPPNGPPADHRRTTDGPPLKAFKNYKNLKLKKKDIDKSISQKEKFQKPNIEEVKAFFRLKIEEKRKEKSCAKKENPGGSNGVSPDVQQSNAQGWGNAEREKIWRLTERFDVEMEAEKLISFYESQGWKVGKNPMKRWRGSASGWFIRSLQRFEERDRRQPKLQQQSKGLAFDLLESNRMAKEMLAKQMGNEPD